MSEELRERFEREIADQAPVWTDLAGDTVVSVSDAATVAARVVERFRAVVADVQRCQENADPSERMVCAMCCNDHFADLAAALEVGTS